MDEWASFQLLNISPNGKTLIIKGKPDTNDNWALYAVDLEGKDTPDELDDDADDYLNAVFNKNNNEVIFTAKTGTNNDDVEIAIKNINNRDRAEVLYEEAILESVEWAELTPFQVLSLWSDMSN